MFTIKNKVGTNRRRKTEDSPLSFVCFSRMCLFSMKPFLIGHNFIEDDAVAITQTACIEGTQELLTDPVMTSV